MTMRRKPGTVYPRGEQRVRKRQVAPRSANHNGLRHGVPGTIWTGKARASVLESYSEWRLTQGNAVQPASPTRKNVSPSRDHCSLDQQAKGRGDLAGGLL